MLSLGCGEEGNFIKCKQLNCDIVRYEKSLAVAMRQTWGEAALRWAPLQLCSALLCTGQSAPFCLLCSGESSSVFQARLLLCFSFSSSQGNTIFSLWWANWARGGLTYIDRSPCPWFLIGLSSCRLTPNPHSLIGVKGTVLIGQNGVALIGWWRYWWKYSCAAPIGQGKLQSYWLK